MDNSDDSAPHSHPHRDRYILLTNLEDKALRDCIKHVDIKSILELVTAVMARFEDPSGQALLFALNKALDSKKTKKRPTINVSPKCRVWSTADVLSKTSLEEVLSPSPNPAPKRVNKRAKKINIMPASPENKKVTPAQTIRDWVRVRFRKPPPPLF